MPHNTDELVELLDLEPIEHSLYRGRQPVTSLQRTFGGQVLAQSLVAAMRTVDEGRRCHSLNAYFMRPGSNTSPIIYDVEELRDGGSFSTRRVVARQDGQKKFAMNCSFHVPEPGLEHGDPAPPDVPAPEDCPPLIRTLERRYSANSAYFREWESLDVRLAGDSSATGSIEARSHGAHMRVWVRTIDALPEDPRLHQAVLAYLSDLTLLSVSVVPHGVSLFTPGMQMASLDHAMWFHHPVQADRWLLYDQISPSASEGLGFSTGRIFQDGRLVATCSQEGLIRLRDLSQ